MIRSEIMNDMILVSEALEKRGTDLLNRLYNYFMSIIAFPVESENFNKEIKIIYYSKSIDPESIIKSFCSYIGLSENDLNLNTRKRKIVQERQKLHVLLRCNTRMSLTNIGITVGGKDHATVLHSHKTVSNLIETNIAYRKKFLKMIDEIGLEYISYK